MAYFAAVKITDIHGNVVELVDTTELLESIHAELKAIRIILNEVMDTRLGDSDVNSIPDEESGQ